MEFFDELLEGKNLDVRSMDIRISSKYARAAWIRVSCEPMVNLVGEVTHIIGAFTDGTDEIHEKHMLEKKASMDELTKVYNRYGGVALIEDYLAQISDDESAGLMMLDLDNFKQANDLYGHSFGDKILVEFTKILRK